MRTALSRRLSYANVVATLALFFALSGGTAYAVHLIVDSSDVVDDSLRGVDVRDGSLDYRDLALSSIGGARIINNSLKGVDIDEASLAKVPDADALDGLDSAAFLKGAGRLLETRQVLSPGLAGLSYLIFWEPGVFSLYYTCNPATSALNAIRFNNLTSGSMDAFSDNGTADPVYRSLAPYPGTNSWEEPASAAGEFHTIDATTDGGTHITIWMMSVRRASDANCLVSVRALYR